MASGELSIESPRCERVTWKIPNFFQLLEEETYCVRSQKFRFMGPHYFQLYSKSKDWVYVCVIDIKLGRWLRTRIPPEPRSKDVSYNLRYLSSSGEEIDFNRIPLTPQRCNSHIVAAFVVPRRKLDANKDSYVPNGIFTLICYLIKKSSAGSPESEDEDREPSVAMLQSDYKHLLQKGANSDALFVVSGKEFRAHRCVLRARSPVFDSMFGHQMAEKQSGRMDVDDLDPDCFVHFLEYLYTGVFRSGLSGKHVFGLYKAADKYDLPTLKQECVAHMRRTLSVDSFCDVITLAQLHREEDLLQRAVSFLKKNLPRIIVTPKWQQFVTDNGTIASELLVKVNVPEGQ